MLVLFLLTFLSSSPIGASRTHLYSVPTSLGTPPWFRANWGWTAGYGFVSLSSPFSSVHNFWWDHLSSYVKFYLDLIASSENISLLYHLSQKGKTVRDPESHTQSVVNLWFQVTHYRLSNLLTPLVFQNFYIMCEIAQILIKAHAQSHSWLLSSYPGKIRLPSDILRPMPNTEATNQVCWLSLLRS